MLCCPLLRNRIQTWLRDYDQLQSSAVILIYIQGLFQLILLLFFVYRSVCALVGSLGALFNGVLLINLAIAQRLGRTAVLLFCAIIVDISWFILFSHQIWNISSEKYSPYLIFSLRLAFLMQILGSSIRLASSLLWIQMYRLGFLIESFLNPIAPGVVSQNSDSEIIGGSIYDPAYYSSLFGDTSQDDGFFEYGGNSHAAVNVSGSTNNAETPQLKSCFSRSFK
ncbi:hypothetical protein MKW92_001450 [Papaver armeniacum]|nr:hypothetical protein MKW92_001450 [Papaver armeniacum]